MKNYDLIVKIGYLVAGAVAAFSIGQNSSASVTAFYYDATGLGANLLTDASLTAVIGGAVIGAGLHQGLLWGLIQTESDMGELFEKSSPIKFDILLKNVKMYAKIKGKKMERSHRMIVISLAGIRVGIDNRYPYIERQCRAFLCDGEADFTVSVSGDEILEEQKFGEFSEGYCESICIYRHICEKMPAYGVFLMHASVIEARGYAYAFSAPSGTGKSTHTALWLKNIEGARVLNGDKPLLRMEEDGSVTAFGTPWNGKENWGENISAPLRAVCFLERGAENKIRRACEEESIVRLAQQLYLRGDRTCVNLQLALMDGLVRAVPFYVLACNISNEAAWLSYRTMSASQ